MTQHDNLLQLASQITRALLSSGHYTNAAVTPPVALRVHPTPCCAVRDAIELAQALYEAADKDSLLVALEILLGLLSSGAFSYLNPSLPRCRVPEAIAETLRLTTELLESVGKAQGEEKAAA